MCCLPQQFPHCLMMITDVNYLRFPQFKYYFHEKENLYHSRFLHIKKSEATLFVTIFFRFLHLHDFQNFVRYRPMHEVKLLRNHCLLHIVIALENPFQAGEEILMLVVCNDICVLKMLPLIFLQSIM